MMKNKVKHQKKEKAKKHITVSTIVLMMIAAIGWYVMTYPLSADRLNRIYNVFTISAAQDSLSMYSNEDLEQMLKKTQEYNEKIAAEQKRQSFKYRGAAATDDEYLSVPIPGSEEMGALYIPKIDLTIAIDHGTASSELQSAAGHLYGTSIPVEGENVHAIIAAHSALASAELFTHINQLENGDMFYITILNKQYAYKVIDSVVCLPEDDWQYEQIEDGKNLVTLYTCTPYGINTHRLLVTGELTETTDLASNDGFTQNLNGKRALYSVELALIWVAPFMALWIYHKITDRKNGSKNKNGGNSKHDKKNKKNRSALDKSRVNANLDDLENFNEFSIF